MNRLILEITASDGCTYNDTSTRPLELDATRDEVKEILKREYLAALESKHIDMQKPQGASSLWEAPVIIGDSIICTYNELLGDDDCNRYVRDGNDSENFEVYDLDEWFTNVNKVK